MKILLGGIGYPSVASPRERVFKSTFQNIDDALIPSNCNLSSQHNVRPGKLNKYALAAVGIG